MKKLLSLITVLCMLFALCACGESSSAAASTTAAPAEETAAETEAAPAEETAAETEAAPAEEAASSGRTFIMGIDPEYPPFSFLGDDGNYTGFDVEICQAFARRNREIMTEIILEKSGMTAAESFHTIHNYIDTDEMILRKGAIAAHAGERVLIPINMRDGSIIAVGRGNEEWNWSAPHGAGRVMSRKKAFETLSLEEYKTAMEGIYTTTANRETLDESPMAYKRMEDIIDAIREAVDIVEIIKPVYNFKAAEKQ